MAASKHLESLGQCGKVNTAQQIWVAVYYIASSETSSNFATFRLRIRYGYRADEIENLEDVYVKSRM